MVLPFVAIFADILAYYFERGHTNVYQILLGHAGQPLATPLRRSDLYESTETYANVKEGSHDLVL
jgi:hypothetical protein